MGKGKERDNRAISKEEAKAEAIRIIEEKLKNVEEKRVEEESREGNNGFVGKKKSHFLSDLKVSYQLHLLPGQLKLFIIQVYVALIIIFLMAVGAVVVKVILQWSTHTAVISTYYQVYVINPKLGITFSETSNQTELEQNKQSNQKYTGGGFIPEYDGYIS